MSEKSESFCKKMKKREFIFEKKSEKSQKYEGFMPESRA